MPIIKLCDELQESLDKEPLTWTDKLKIMLMNACQIIILCCNLAVIAYANYHLFSAIFFGAKNV